MSSVVSAVATAVGAEAQVTRCSKERCTVSLDGISDRYVVIDLDHPSIGFPPGPRCDYVVAVGGGVSGWASPLELKGETYQIPHVVRQLQAGADAVDRWLPPHMSAHIRPVLAYGGTDLGVRRRAALKQVRLDFRGRKSRVRTIPCGGRLIAATAA